MNLLKHRYLSWQLAQALKTKDRLHAEKLEKYDSGILNFPVEDDTGHSALTLAVCKKSLSHVQFVMSLGANPNLAVNVNSGLSALHYIAQTTDFDVNMKKILVEIMHCRIEKVNVDIESVQILNEGTYLSQTPLMTAVIYDNIKFIKELLLLNANINAIESMIGGTALLLACGKANYDVIKLLLDAGADIKQSSAGQFGVLHWFANNNRDIPECVDLLISEGAIVDQASLKDRLTPLMLAAYNGLYNSVAVLLANGADPSIRDFYGRNCITFARMLDDEQLGDKIITLISKHHNKS
ncbi:hypothetical protein GJ496_008619 [Pomphorhynchus laevis]|nr:hypothetical protein GJ496_008619 [Pomphorhynchus laevis]